MTYDVLNVDLNPIGTIDIEIPFGINTLQLAEQLPLSASYTERFEGCFGGGRIVTFRVGQPVIVDPNGPPKAFLIVISGDVTRVRSFVPLENR